MGNNFVVQKCITHRARPALIIFVYAPGTASLETGSAHDIRFLLVSGNSLHALPQRGTQLSTAERFLKGTTFLSDRTLVHFVRVCCRNSIGL